MSETYYKKHFIVHEYIPGLQGCCDEQLNAWEFEDEDAARDFKKLKTEDATINKSWLCYRISERYVTCVRR